jgi:hypothetical protein
VGAYDATLPSEDPVAEFTASHTIATTLDFVEFFDDSADYDGDIALWNWDFDDGVSSPLWTPAHRYLAACQFAPHPQCTIELEATDTDGNSRTRQRTILIMFVQED